MRKAALALAALLPLTARAEPSIAAAPPAANTSATGSVPDLRARIYVKDLDHLAQLVSADPVVGTQARDLAGRVRRTTSVALLGGLVGGALFTTGGALLVNDVDDRLGSPTFGERTSDRGPALMVAGGITLAATLVYALARMPRTDDLFDVVNAWNVRHPAEPLEVVALRGRGGRLHDLAMVQAR